MIDTSISMKENFQIVKDNLSLLFQVSNNVKCFYYLTTNVFPILLRDS